MVVVVSIVGFGGGNGGIEKEMVVVVGGEIGRCRRWRRREVGVWPPEERRQPAWIAGVGRSGASGGDGGGRLV